MVTLAFVVAIAVYTFIIVVAYHLGRYNAFLEVNNSVKEIERSQEIIQRITKTLEEFNKEAKKEVEITNK